MNNDVKYSCECIPKIAESVKKEYGGVELLSVAQFINYKTGELTYGFQPFFFNVPKKLKDGTRSRTAVTKEHISFRYCPICGKKL